MSERPTSVTVISWLVIVSSVLVLVLIFIAAVYFTGFTPRSMPLLFWLDLVMSLFGVALGVGMLNGKNLARQLFLLVRPISIVIAFFLEGVTFLMLSIS